MKGYANSDLLTTPDELQKALNGATPPLVIDLRPPEDFAIGHIPGAVHLDLWGVSLIDTDPAPLKAFMWMIDHLLNLRGVNESTPVVVYDEQSGVRAARAFWFLEYFGHPSVRLLDGGFGAWTRACQRLDGWTRRGTCRHVARRARCAVEEGCRAPRCAQ